jgi:phosphatidate cytidylyltransferase
MADTDSARQANGAGAGGSDLFLRLCSALVLGPLAIGVAYLGGWPFMAFWGVAAVLVFWEWTALVSGEHRRSVFLIGAAGIAFVCLLLGIANYADRDAHPYGAWSAALVLAMGALGAAALSPREQRLWIVAGIPYAGLLGVAPILLRSDAQYGLLAIVFLFAVVWATDIFAYFAGRAFGGPKLAPRVSPKKTWSGALGGVVAAIGTAVAIANLAGLEGKIAIVLVAIVLSLVTQAGDLFESALKRRFGVKDSSHLIPGHGGLMDRLDGFVAAAIVGLAIGLFRGGLEAPARGLLVW